MWLLYMRLVLLLLSIALFFGLHLRNHTPVVEPGIIINITDTCNIIIPGVLNITVPCD